MSIIAINGSPRAEGNTAKLTREVLTGAVEAGADVKLFQLGSMKVAACRGCLLCKPTAKCIIEDDMSQIYQAIESAHNPKGLVIGTPIYFDHITAQLKTWLDRLFSYTYTELGQKMFPKGFRAVLLATYDDGSPDRYDPVLDWLAGRLEYYHEVKTIARIVQPSATIKPLAQQADLIAKARQAGRELAAK